MLASLETSTEFVTDLLHKVRIRFEEDGFLHPVSFIAAQVNPETGESFEKPGIIVITPELLGVSMKDSYGTELYTMGLRQISRICKAIMVVNVMEAWQVIFPKDTDMTKIPKGSLEHVPGREECIRIMMEHQKLGTQVMMWCALITRDEQKRGILAEFVGPETIEGTGRFLGMVEIPS
jgi:hypothetical protein